MPEQIEVKDILDCIKELTFKKEDFERTISNLSNEVDMLTNKINLRKENLIMLMDKI